MSSGDSETLPKEEISEQEAKVRAKFGNMKPKTTDFLQQRLQRKVKYFDSGDYNMSKTANPSQVPVGKAHPTPDNLPRKKPVAPSKLASTHK
ncbi:cAMP-regulated phosphoprotein 19 [Trichoplax sp. H2]|nr:cAMP-regulated phosphoprotein 19 [Trichoplax sp. H2]|eukprot:RDD46310.1 cAMP-regulated phosphoprotein 19 [Trichoplax sp. H2]